MVRKQTMADASAMGIVGSSANLLATTALGSNANGMPGSKLARSKAQTKRILEGSNASHRIKIVKKCKKSFKR